MKSPTSPKKKAGSLLKAGLAFVIVGLLVVASLVIYLGSCPLAAGGEPAGIYVQAGASTRDVAELLLDQGIIRSAPFFRILARVMGTDGKIQAGEYRFEIGDYAWNVLRSLLEGQAWYYSLTVYEGLEVEEIASLFEDRGFGDREELLALAADPSLLPAFVAPEEVLDTKYPLEGYLFPDTYYVPKDVTVEEIVSMMRSRFDQNFSQDVLDQIRLSGLTPHEAATLASIVEREAFVAEERPIIAAVYLNRLRIGMKLDACPTVIYAMGEERGYHLLYKDLEFDSLYNTYANPGLPPGPIGNFGKASLEAVLRPADNDYLYFVAKSDGSHAFAYSLTEHNANVRQYQGD